MPAPYIPPKDADFQSWFLNFKTLIAASPATYGLVAADATTITGQYNLWNAAFALAIAGTTRGPFTIANKDAAKITALATIRPYAQQIANNAGVTSGNKIALGLNPRTNTPEPVAAPLTAPVLLFVGNSPLQTWLRYRDSLALPTSRAKPSGAIQCNIFAVESATPVVDPTTIPYFGSFTKVPVILDWPADLQGLTVWIAAQWVTRTGLQGPFGPIISVIVS